MKFISFNQRLAFYNSLNKAFDLGRFSSLLIFFCVFLFFSTILFNSEKWVWVLVASRVVQSSVEWAQAQAPDDTDFWKFQISEGVKSSENDKKNTIKMAWNTRQGLNEGILSQQIPKNSHKLPKIPKNSRKLPNIFKNISWNSYHWARSSKLLTLKSHKNSQK